MAFVCPACVVRRVRTVEWTKREAGLTTIATKKCPIYFSIDIGKMQVRSVANDWQRWQLKQKFAIVDGKTKAVDVNPSLSAIDFLQMFRPGAS